MDKDEKITGGADAGGGEPQKTYSEADFDAEVSKRVSAAIEDERTKWNAEYEERLKAEKDEAARLAKMSADERAKAEFDKKVKEFDADKAKYDAERLEFECTKLLASEKLPPEMAPMLTGKDADSTRANIETFRTLFSKAVESAAARQLKGKTPRVNAPSHTGDSWAENVRRGAGLK